MTPSSTTHGDPDLSTMTVSELFEFNLSEKRRAQPALNREGMTFDEWYAAANCFRTNKLPANATTLTAWYRGEDPTEYGVE